MAKRNKVSEQASLYENGSLPSFTSTPEEIKRAVESGAIRRGSLLVKVIVSLRIDEILDTLNLIKYDKEDIYERRQELNIDEAALTCLDNANPPIAYPLYFATPEFIIDHPELVMYYRNIAMLSRKVMRGIGLPTDGQEDRGIPPSQEFASELAKYFNGIICKFVLETGVSRNRHLEILLSNIGDALGGVSRNEVGRYAASQIVRLLVIHWKKLGYLYSIQYALKKSYIVDESVEENQDNENTVQNGSTQVFYATPNTDVEQFLDYAESNRVKYQEIVLNNGYRLQLDKQLTWAGTEKSYKIGVDLVSKSVSIDLEWGGEIKGGADPAGSDEHWKTATQALNRILEAAEKTGHQKPKLSFFATILVDRVAIEAQQWIDEGRLTSVYNLTKISENESELNRFLEDMTRFVGY